MVDAASPSALEQLSQSLTPPPDGLAVPRDFDARYGEGLPLGVSLGGGGVYFVAWQVSYLYELVQRGVDLPAADRVVGTSAGSVVSSVIEAGNLARLYKELTVLSRVPKVLGALAPAGTTHPSQERALALFGLAADGEADTVREIGHAALAAVTPGPGVMRRNISLILASRKWPSPALHVTCVDAFTAERCVVTSTSGVGIARAVAASSAVPGLFAPQPIGQRRCMDGGVSGTGIHLDLLAGCDKAVVLALTDGAGETVGRMTAGPGSIEAELDALRASGTDVFFRKPETMDIETLMDPTKVPDAVAMGRRQAAADAADLREFLASA